MKLPLIALYTALLAAPVVSMPTPADAQVLTGSGRASTPRRAPRPPLSPAEEDRLFEAQSLVIDLEAEITAIEDAGEDAGGLTAEQQVEIQQRITRRDEAQRIVDRLEAKRARRS